METQLICSLLLSGLVIFGSIMAITMIIIGAFLDARESRPRVSRRTADRRRRMRKR